MFYSQAAEDALKDKLAKKRLPVSAESESPEGKKLKKAIEKVIVEDSKQLHKYAAPPLAELS